ncbi:MAG: hypothetical protein NDI61_03160 [Bdellovibrionaceae bacterium]|nr:hypothetical protein [Pseudobdellovibrionaceae bacterium]
MILTQNGTDHSALVAQLETWTREGQNQKVLSALLGLKLKAIPRNFRSDFAQIARRINQPLLSLRFLNSIVRSPFVLDEPPNGKEKVIYATTLTALGSLGEADEILSEVNHDEEPDVNLYRAFICFRRWDYARAIPLLRTYLRSPGLSEYSVVVGQVNLIAALVADARVADARAQIRPVLEKTRRQEMWLLHGNTLELLAQVEMLSGNWVSSLKHLEDAEKILKSTNAMYYFFVLKWQAIVRCLQHPNSVTELARLREVRRQAIFRQYWEGVRDLDLYAASTRRSESALMDVVRGTPFLSFRARAERVWGGPLPGREAGPYALLDIGGSASGGESVFDPSSTSTSVLLDHRDLNSKPARDLDMNPLLLKAFDVLIRDRYRPVPLGALFYELFPDEYFDPFYGPKKISNLVARLRRKLEEWRWPLDLQVRRNELSIRPRAAGVQVMRHARPLARSTDFWSMAKSEFIGRSFTVAQLAHCAKRSRSYALRLVREALRRGEIIASGHGPARVYRFSHHRFSERRRRAS